MKEKLLLCASIIMAFGGIITMGIFPKFLAMRNLGYFYSSDVLMEVNKLLNQMLNGIITVIAFLFIIAFVLCILRKKKAVFIIFACIIMISQYVFEVKPVLNNYSSQTILNPVVIDKSLEEQTITVKSLNSDNYTVTLQVTNSEVDLITVGDVFDVINYKTLNLDEEVNYLTNITVIE